MSLLARSSLIWGLRVPTPVPWFKRNPMHVVARVGEGEAEARCIPLQPRERRRAIEDLFERVEPRRREIDTASAVVLAVTRRSADAQDFVDGQSACAFAFHDAELVLHGTKCRNDLQFDSVSRRGLAHMYQGSRGARLQPLRAAMDVGADGDEPRRFTLHAQFPGATVIARNAERESAFQQRAAFARVAAAAWRCSGIAARVIHALA